MQEASELEIYIHIPFCVRKCSYCDFLSFPCEEKTKEEYVNALLNEIKYRKNTEVAAKGLSGSFVVTSVFVGGGTPTSIRPEFLREILEKIRESFVLSEDAEITFECNPATAGYEDFVKLRAAGYNRISIGLQSAVDEELKRIGRIHDFVQFKKTYDEAVKAGFENINLDIITALPEQKKKDVQRTLDSVLALEPRPKHISAYSLILEPGTEFDRMDKKGELTLPDEDSEREFHWTVIDRLEENGYRQYELSNLSMPGYECRHNIGYWIGRDYLGFGLGASSFFDGTRYTNTRSLKEYLECYSREDVSSVPAPEEFEVLTDGDKQAEFMFLGLRMTEGIRPEEFLQRFGKSVYDVYGDSLNKHISEGLLETVGDRLRLTRKGQDVANYVFSDFV